MSEQCERADQCQWDTACPLYEMCRTIEPEAVPDYDPDAGFADDGLYRLDAGMYRGWIQPCRRCVRGEEGDHDHYVFGRGDQLANRPMIDVQLPEEIQS